MKNKKFPIFPISITIRCAPLWRKVALTGTDPWLLQLAEKISSHPMSQMVDLWFNHFLSLSLSREDERGDIAMALCMRFITLTYILTYIHASPLPIALLLLRGWLTDFSGWKWCPWIVYREDLDPIRCLQLSYQIFLILFDIHCPLQQLPQHLIATVDQLEQLFASLVYLKGCSSGHSWKLPLPTIVWTASSQLPCPQIPICLDTNWNSYFTIGLHIEDEPFASILLQTFKHRSL